MKFTREEREKIKPAYYGSCKQFPYQTGETKLERVAGVDTAFCKEVQLDGKATFSDVPKDPVKVLLSVVWNNRTEEPHDASAAWAEQLTRFSFKACVMVAGRHFLENRINSPPSVQWVAYQDGITGSTENLEVGSFKMKTWYSGSRCQSIKMYNEKYSISSKIFVSVEHTGNKRSLQNAMTAWVERNEQPGAGHVCKICARELQNFDGIHSGIKINYLVVHEATRPFVTEPRQVHFKQQHFSEDQAIPPICKTVLFNNDFPRLTSPVVQVTAVNTSNNVKNSHFSPHDIAVWIESQNDTHLTACFKSLRAGLRREEVTLHYTIFPTLCKDGYRFHNGQCFRSEKTTNNGTNAREECEADRATLPTFKNYRERASKLYFLKNHVEDSNMTFVHHDAKDDGRCSMFSFKDQEMKEVNCTENSSPFVCQRPVNMLDDAEGCQCENGGECSSEEEDQGVTGFMFTKPPMCKCKQGYMGERCEKMFAYNGTNCDNYYEHKSNFMERSFRNDRWYRFPGREMIEYCPSQDGCAGINGQRPTDGEMVQRNMTYSGHRSSMYSRHLCQNTNSKVHIQNCGDFNIYKFVDVEIKRGSRLCLERYPQEEEDDEEYDEKDDDDKDEKKEETKEDYRSGDVEMENKMDDRKDDDSDKNDDDRMDASTSQYGNTM